MSKTLDLMKELKQDEIIKRYEAASAEEKAAFDKQVEQMEKVYPGGIREYCKRAKVLLEDSKNGVNPFSDFTPSIPEGFNVKVGDDKFYELEKIGCDELKDTCFVLVAGGLGERLGYSDIKIGIQTNLVTKKRFIEIYVGYILAYEKRVKKVFPMGDDWFIPLVIMTSGDTNDKTIKLLEANNNFGMRKDQITIVKQEKCPALLDNDCHLAVKKDKLELETKPHGHGDIHTLLYQNKIIDKWVQKGKKWFVLFQDTNALIFNCIPSAIGVSKSLNLAINTICIPRKPGEAVGGICKLTKKDGSSITNNVEYNQLDPLLRAKYNKDGDVPNKEGLSDFPGNTNVLIFEITPYYKALNRTKGLMPEFVNPKYANAEKTVFKSPTRLECLMQDFPKLLTDNEKVGFCMYEKWFCFSTCKNNLKDGCDKLKKGLSAETAFSEEQDIYFWNIKVLKEILGKLTIDTTEPDETLQIEGTDVKFGPKIILEPSFAVTVSELKQKVKGNWKIFNNSALVVRNDIKIERDLTLNGYLTIENDQVDNLVCENKQRMKFVLLKPGEGENYEQIRGYTVTLVLNENNKI